MFEGCVVLTDSKRKLINQVRRGVRDACERLEVPLQEGARRVRHVIAKLANCKSPLIQSTGESDQMQNYSLSRAAGTCGLQ